MATTELTDEVRAKRVAVAKDVIAQVEGQRLSVAFRSYLEPLFGEHERVEEIIRDARMRGLADLQGVVDDIAPRCRVCARGAMMLSKARLYNAVPLGLLSYPGMVDQDDTTKALEDIFDGRTLAMIEAGFERSTGLCDSLDASEDDMDRAAHFSSGLDPESRVLDVMRNLVEHDGEFVP